MWKSAYVGVYQLLNSNIKFHENRPVDAEAREIELAVAFHNFVKASNKTTS